MEFHQIERDGNQKTCDLKKCKIANENADRTVTIYFEIVVYEHVIGDLA